MAEEGVSGITELQVLEAEVTSLQKTLDAVQKAEPASAACSRVVSSIKAAEQADGFVIKEGGEDNKFHNSSGQTGDGGCCTIL